MAGKIERLLMMFRAGLSIGENGTHLRKVVVSSVSINPASNAAVTRLAVTFALAGAKVGDGLICNQPAGLNDDLIYEGCAVTADDVATIYLYNPTGGAIDDGALTWIYTWIKKG